MSPHRPDGPPHLLHGRIALVNPRRAIWDAPRTDPDLAPDRRRSIEDINTCVLHTTGYGKFLERADRKYAGDEQRVGYLFARFQANNLEYKPHFLVDRAGAVYQLVPLGYRAHHTGSGNRGAYRREGWAEVDRKGVNVSWWPKRFEGLASPLDLPAWEPIETASGRKVYSINSRSWAVDLLAPKPGEAYTEAQVKALAELVAYGSVNLRHPADALHVLDHSSVNPLDRSNAKGPWDFDARFDWETFRKALRDERKRLGYDDDRAVCTPPAETTAPAA